MLRCLRTTLVIVSFSPQAEVFSITVDDHCKKNRRPIRYHLRFVVQEGPNRCQQTGIRCQASRALQSGTKRRLRACAPQRGRKRGFASDGRRPRPRGALRCELLFDCDGRSTYRSIQPHRRRRTHCVEYQPHVLHIRHFGQGHFLYACSSVIL